jgi:hypothetical protein
MNQCLQGPKDIESARSIKAIYIGNVLEGFFRSYEGLATEDRSYWTLYDSLEGNRALFYNGDNKIVITSYPVVPQHVESISDLMDWDDVFNISPRFPTQSLCEDIMRPSKFRELVEDIIVHNPGIAIIPYRGTSQFYQLVNAFKRKKLNFTTPETIPPEQEFVTTYSHCKRGFRHLWSKAFPSKSKLAISLPEGFITGNRDEAIEASWWFQQQKRSFVIKYNRGVQGIGIIMNYHSKLPDTKNAFFEKLKSMLTDKIWDEPSIVVEELMEADKDRLGGSPNVEFMIDEDGEINRSYACEQVLADDHKTFRGAYIHPELLGNRHIQTAFKAGAYFGRELARLGYRGCFDIDLVISHDDKLYAVESNLRRTGGTHIHEAAESLLGREYMKKYHVIGEDIPLPEGVHLSYDRCNQLLEDLKYKQDTHTGFLFGNPDMLQVNILHAFFFANSHAAIQRIRTMIHNRIEKLALS